ncbi:MAG: transposase [Bacteroidales bacterium]
MSQSLSKLYVHLVFHIKCNSCTIRKQESKRLYAYMGKLMQAHNSIPIIINGVDNHVHIFLVLSKNIALADLVKDIKRKSSRWIKTLDSYYQGFAWQGGYGAFSVSSSLYNKTKQYIANQEVHHAKRTFEEEYVMFLKEYAVEFDERYLWRD